jgi:iron complex transport system substrate-binding protein
MVRSRFLTVLVPAALLLLAAQGAGAMGPMVPTRIISLSPTATEDLFAIGAGMQVVAVDNDSDYPPSAPRTKLSGYTPNAEAVAAYKPDLVVVSYDGNHIVEALKKLKIPVLVEPTASTLDQAYGQIDALGKATGRPMQAESLVASMKKRIAAIVASVPHASPPITVYHELEPDLYSATSKTFIGRIYTMLGLKDIADAAGGAGSGYPQLSQEFVVAADPRLIVLADTVCCGQTVAKLDARPGWSTVAAVKNGDVLAVNDDVASRWGPRIVDFVAQVASKVKELEKK